MNKIEEIKRLADNMYEAAQYLTTDASRLKRAMEEYKHYINFGYNTEGASLTPKDCEGVMNAFFDYMHDISCGRASAQETNEALYEEVLRRFNEKCSNK